MKDETPVTNSVEVGKRVPAYWEVRQEDAKKEKHCKRCWEDFAWGGNGPECRFFGCGCHKGNWIYDRDARRNIARSTTEPTLPENAKGD